MYGNSNVDKQKHIKAVKRLQQTREFGLVSCQGKIET